MKERMSERYVGEIRIFGGKYAPKDWAFCDGSLLSIAENQVLYMLLGNNYGGDGVQTFGLPDLRGRTPIHGGAGSGYVLGQIGGYEKISLTSQHIPAHTHLVAAKAESSDSATPQNNYFGLSNVALNYVNGDPKATMAANAMSPYGGSQSHDNMMPFFTLNYIIALNGIFPSQG
jgi:microcystin-dependent protein